MKIILELSREATETNPDVPNIVVVGYKEGDEDNKKVLRAKQIPQETLDSLKKNHGLDGIKELQQMLIREMTEKLL